jgi:hypothetical protein
LTVKNVGYQLKAFRTGRDPLPIDLGLGLGYQPNPALNLALDLHKLRPDRFEFRPDSAGRVGTDSVLSGLGQYAKGFRIRAGVEGWVADLLAVRVGYTTEGLDLQAGGGEDILAGLTTGLGFRWRGYQLDYCFIPMVELGVAHRLSLAFSL